VISIIIGTRKLKFTRSRPVVIDRYAALLEVKFAKLLKFGKLEGVTCWWWSLL